MKNKIYILFCSVCLAIFWVPTIFLGDIISHKFVALPFLYYVCMACLYAFLLRSEKIMESILKWGVSLPVSYFVFQFFRKTDYALRSLNWGRELEEYGKPSAGVKFAFMFEVQVFCLFCIAAVIGIYQIKICNWKSAKKAQISVGSVIGVLIVMVALVLERMFPSYESIFGG